MNRLKKMDEFHDLLIHVAYLSSSEGLKKFFWQYSLAFYAVVIFVTPKNMNKYIFFFKDVLSVFNYIYLIMSLSLLLVNTEQELVLS